MTETYVERIEDLARRYQKERDINYAHYMFEQSRLNRCKQENKRLRKALEFYADDYKWHEENMGSPYMPDYRMEIQTDGGDVARKALGVEFIG